MEENRKKEEKSHERKKNLMNEILNEKEKNKM